MEIKDNLASLEILRDFVESHVPIETYMLCMLIDGKEVSNFRLWALREILGMDESTFARELNTSTQEYHGFERSGNQIPREFLQKVAEKYDILLDWLLCKKFMLPIPKKKKHRA